MHGGLACTLLDSAMGCAVNSTLKVRKSTQQDLRVLAVMQKKTVYDLTEEILHEGIKKRVLEWERKHSSLS